MVRRKLPRATLRGRSICCINVEDTVCQRNFNVRGLVTVHLVSVSVNPEFDHPSRTIAAAPRAAVYRLNFGRIREEFVQLGMEALQGGVRFCPSFRFIPGQLRPLVKKVFSHHCKGMNPLSLVSIDLVTKNYNPWDSVQFSWFPL